ncbi:MAG: hypothetical protein WC292_01070 [Clostridia bacterium]
MKKTTKKLLISIMILLAAVSLATATTYAWFTMNNTPEVETFDLNVTSVDGLYISLSGDEGTFKQYISTTEITNHLLANFSYTVGEGEDATQVLKKLTHATTEGDGIYDIPADNKITQMNTDGTETTSYEFTLYFRSANAYQVTLKTTGDSKSAVTSVQGENPPAPIEAWADGLSFAKDGTTAAFDRGHAIAARAQDAVRIAFYDGTNRFFWDPNPTSGFTDNTYMGNVAARHHNFKHGSKFGDTIDADVPEVDGGGTVDQVISIVESNVNTTATPTTLLTLVLNETTNQYNGTLTITLWLEGWDANALNSVLSDIITTELVFQGVL